MPYAWSDVRYSFMYREWLETPAGLALETYTSALLYEAAQTDNGLDHKKLELIRDKYADLRQRALESVMDAVCAKSNPMNPLEVR